MKFKKIHSLIVLAILLFASCENNSEVKTIEGNWEVQSIMDQSNFDLTPNFIINLKTLKIAGFSGCNNFFGSLTTNNGELSFDKMGGTRRSCPDLTAENLFITTIPQVKFYVFKNNYLQFLSESKEVLMTLRPIEKE